jgi:hypothetical protein
MLCVCWVIVSFNLSHVLSHSLILFAGLKVEYRRYFAPCDALLSKSACAAYDAATAATAAASGEDRSWKSQFLFADDISINNGDATSLLSATVTNLAGSTSYEVRVRAVRGELLPGVYVPTAAEAAVSTTGLGPASSTVVADTLRTHPDAPSVGDCDLITPQSRCAGVNFVAINEREVTIAWERPAFKGSSGVAKYQVRIAVLPFLCVCVLCLFGDYI